MSSNRAVSFFIRFHNFDKIPEFTMKNGQNEKLVMKGRLPWDCYDTLMRYPMEASEEWIEAMEHEEDWEYRNVSIDI
jgi:hypothetical protein